MLAAEMDKLDMKETAPAPQKVKLKRKA